MPVTNTCDRCNGTGEYQGTRRDGSTYVGACFACQPGTGARYAGRWNRSVPRPTPSESIVAPYTGRQRASVDAFAAAFPAESRWLSDNAASNTFAASLLNGIARYGNLTPRQLAAVQRNLPTGDHAPVAPAPLPTPEADAARLAFLDSALAESARHGHWGGVDARYSAERDVIRARLAPAPVDSLAWDSPEAAAARRAEIAARPASVPVRPIMVPTDSLAAAAAALADDYFIVATTPGRAADIRTPHADDLRRAAERARVTDAALAVLPRPTAPVVAPPVTIAAAEMRTALFAARTSGLRRPRLTLGLYEFRLGRTGTNRADTIYIYTRENIRTTRFAYAGAVSPDDRFFPATGYGRVVLTAEQMDMIRDAAANPRNAAAAHGHETTHCSCCRRLLTDPPSVMAGIGPVCITRFGWL